MFKVRVFITLRESILDPAGAAVQGSLHHLGFADVRDVRVCKMIELTVEKAEHIEMRVEQMCEKLLVNPVMETYSYEIEEIGA